jgi:hypothetical protein
VQRLAQADVLQDAVEQDGDRRRHAEDDDEHLLDVGPGHRLHAADRRAIIGMQMTSTVTGSDQPRIADITTDGAARVTPSDAARPTRNRKLASERTRTSNRRSRYRHCVDAAPVKNGTTVSDRITIASGRPKQNCTKRRPDRYRGWCRRCDGAHLRRHHRQPDRPPRQRAVREE